MEGENKDRQLYTHVLYSGYFSGGKIFVRSEFLASSWKNFHGHGILNHTSVHCGTVLWVKISWFASQPQKPRKFYPPKNTHYTVYVSMYLHSENRFIGAESFYLPG